ncbi:cytochrome P450 3A14-like [Artemia franciscana]
MGVIANVFGTAVVVYVLQWYFNRRKIYKTFKNLGIPGPDPNLFFGNLWTLRWSKNLSSDCLSEWRQQYGNMYGYYFGVVPHLVVYDLDILRNVLIRDFSIFSNRPKIFQAQAKEIKLALQGLRDTRWKEVRSTLTPTFSMSKLKVLSKFMSESVDKVSEVLKDKARSGEEVDIHEVYQRLTAEVIAVTALAISKDLVRNPHDEFLAAVRKIFRNTMNSAVMVSMYFPGLQSTLAFLAKFSVLGKMSSQVTSNIQNEIDKRKNGLYVNDSGRTDLLQLMLDARKKDKLSRGLSDDDIIANVWSVMLAGYETTSNTLSFCSYLLAKHPDIQEKLLQAILDKFGDGEVTYEGVHEIDYLDQVVSETLRVFTPLPNFKRELAEDTVIGPYKIPAGTAIECSSWEIHHDPDIWPEPYKFKPERFEADQKAARHPMAWIPFGAGPRQCIGMRYALLEIKMSLCKLLRQYRFIPSAKTEFPELNMIPSVTTNPKNGIWLKIEQRI